MEVFVVITPSLEKVPTDWDVEVLDSAPAWDWRLRHQIVRVASVNGGDSEQYRGEPAPSAFRCNPDESAGLAAIGMDRPAGDFAMFTPEGNRRVQQIVEDVLEKFPDRSAQYVNSVIVGCLDELADELGMHEAFDTMVRDIVWLRVMEDRARRAVS